MTLNQDYKEMLSILIEHNVDFLLVGAYEIAAHGLSGDSRYGSIYFKRQPSDLNGSYINNQPNRSIIFEAHSK